MNTQEKQILQRVADTIRVLSAEAIEQVNSGHPGLPLGCAEAGAVLFSRIMRHNPANPNWPGRDRFVLSAGHGSMLLYSLLHLTGFGLSTEQLASFRHLKSETPGHPELGETAGVEVTTGPLGQGLGMGAGMAVAQRLMDAQIGGGLFDGKVFVLASDGDMMEGISHEVGAIAGHLKLHPLVVLYDNNQICLDGPTSDCLTDDVLARFRAYGWKVNHVDGHDLEALETALVEARAERSQPTLISMRTVIGKGAPQKQGSSGVHGAPLGAEELARLKEGLGWPAEPFHVPAEVAAYFEERKAVFAGYEREWNEKLAALRAADPEKGKLYDTFAGRSLPADFDEQLWNAQVSAGKATRVMSGEMINHVARLIPFFYSGSADLSVSDNTAIKGMGTISPEDFSGRTFKFGVREFGMAAICNGMAAFGMVQPLCGTFFTFSDYMRNALRLAAIMRQRVIYQFTHDSIFVGEDGPTHQPIEHLASLRAMPGFTLFRPCDENELRASWIEAFKTQGPVALILTRQNLKSQGEASRANAREGVARGGYILHGESGDVDVLIAATGSEVEPAMGAARLLEAEGKRVRVVSLPSWQRFDAQDAAYRESVLGGQAALRVSVEAGATLGWHKYVGADGLTIGIDTFGASGNMKDLADYYGLTPEKIAGRIGSELAARAATAGR